MKKLLFIIAALTLNAMATAQSCTGVSAGTPGTTTACYNFGNANAGSGSSPCAGSGHGGSGSVRIIQFCTNSTAQCVEFSLSGLSSSDGTAYALYTGCSGGTLSGYVSGSAKCDGNSSTSVYTTAGLNLSPNTCYYLMVWTKNAPASTAQVCIKRNPAVNDYCSGASPISTTSQSFNNYCMTAGSNGSYTEPAPGQFCAGSLENNAWYSFVTSTTCVSPCTVVVSFTGISCSGGGSGFQIGYWTGSCSSLSYLGCTSGSGGSVTTTITGLSPGQTVILGMDGNAGANCSYSLSATNTQPLPITLMSFDLKHVSDGIQLNWATASEKNNRVFEIERSRDAMSFEKIGEVSGAGNSTQMKEYAYTDKSLRDGVYYYRIRQVDYDGSFSYSHIRAAKVQGMSLPGFDIIPNPGEADNTVSLLFYDMGEIRSLEVLDVTGKVVFKSYSVTDNKILLPPLPKGLYFVSASGAESQVIKKLVIK